jgi:hypothetical protein
MGTQPSWRSLRSPVDPTRDGAGDVNEAHDGGPARPIILANQQDRRTALA